jgi:hypothetical protein
LNSLLRILYVQQFRGFKDSMGRANIAHTR